MSGRLQGKVAVITGSSSGIGLATAKRFVREGAYVFVTGRRQEELDKAAAEIGKNVTTVRGDVSKLEDIESLYNAVAAQKKKIDIVFANAGFVELKLTPDVTLSHRGGRGQDFDRSVLSDNPSRDNGWSGYLTGKNSTQGGDR